MKSDYVIETSREIETDAGTFRLQVLADPEGTGDPRKWSDAHLGVMVAHDRGYSLPEEGEWRVEIIHKLADREERGFRIVSRWLRMFHGATVVLPIFSGGGGSELRLSAGTLDDDGSDGRVLGVIYDTPQTREDMREGATEADIAGWLAEEVRCYDTWANGEMTMWAVEKATVEDPNEDDWEHVDSLGSYYSVEEAREVGMPELERIAADAQAEYIEELHAEALVENNRTQLRPWVYAANRGALLYPAVSSDDEADAPPEVEVAGVAVSVYVTDQGVLRVSVHTDTGEVDPPLLRDGGDRVAMRIKVNDSVVFEDAGA